MEEPARFKQYVGTLGVTLGGLALGTVIGWSSPASELIKQQLNVLDNDISWISSIMPIGAAAVQLYLALTLDLFGRKLSILIISVPFVIGWLIIIFATTIPMYCIGRFITGFCGGSFCVIAPTYIAEISDKGARGTLSVFFQFMLVIGVLLSYCLGEFSNLLILNIPLTIIPGLVFIIVLFLPESPVYLYKKGKIEESRKSLQFYRGSSYNIDLEMKQMEEYIKSDEESFWKKFKTKPCIKAFIMLLFMHAVQQCSGVNAVLFFAHDIFKMAGSSFDSGTSAIILAVVQVILAGFSAYLVDKTGRNLLWIISLSSMAICLILIGTYFMLQTNDPEEAENISWLPLVVICLYLAAFSLGAGPLPWVMIGEFLPNSVKEYVGPFISSFNWLLAFAITKSFVSLKDAIGADVLFWSYAGVCIAGAAFVIFFLIETKNKTLEEIQYALNK